jgi:thiol-disulfide isomerase/thioredoxin
MARRRSGTTAVAVAVLLALSGCSSSLAGGGAPDKGYLPGDGSISKVGVADREAPIDLAGVTLQGKSFDLSDHRGDVVVVNVWGSWCPPCVKEAPALEEVWAQSQAQAQGVAFVGINTRDEPTQARAHERRFGVSYPSIGDDEGRVLLSLRGTLPPKAIPSTLVLDREGRVAYRVLSAVRAATLRGLIQDTLAEAPASPAARASR